MVEVLVRWVEAVTRAPRTVLVIVMVLTGLSCWVAMEQFRIHSDLGDLIDQKTPWREDFDRYKADFPDLVKTAVIVVSGGSFKAVEDASLAVEAALRARPQTFESVFAPANEPFFRDHALLYLNLDELDDAVDRLAQAQPVLASVARGGGVVSVLSLIGDGVTEVQPAGFATVVANVAASGRAALDGTDPTIKWADELFPGEGVQRRLIVTRARADFAAAVPNALVMSQLREVIRDLALPDGVRVGVTGEIALEVEELEAAIGGITTAGWLVLVLLLGVMVVGVRSAKIIAATFLMLAIGIVWTAAFALMTVGSFNTLSIVFLVMFFGLGVDFSLHFCLRYQEALNAGAAAPGMAAPLALTRSTASVGRAIFLCTLTTAVAFLSFWPTDYRGLAELGIISAGGMVIAMILTFTFLPAFFAVSGAIRSHAVDLPSSDRVVAWLVHRRLGVVAVLVMLSVVATAVAVRAHFDYSVLALKDENAPSMRTLRELQSAGEVTDYALSLVVPSGYDTRELEALEVVEKVTTPQDYLPQDQSDKAFVLEDLRLIMSDAFDVDERIDVPLASDIRQSVQSLLAILGDAPDSQQDAGLYRLGGIIGDLATSDDAVLIAWQLGVIQNLTEEVAWLGRAMQVDSVAFEDLPEGLRKRLVTADGRWLVTITPSEDVTDVAALTRFIESVRAIAPTATGRPVIEWGVGRIVQGAFQEALVVAIVAIALILVVILRSLRDALLILVPLALTVVCTLAVGVLFQTPLNMASILVVPLIFGLGVDNGIHVVDRYRNLRNVDRLMHSSTPRAVVLSTLTTIGAFAALSVSPHAGTASIGLLLTIAIGLLLLLTLFVLPVLLSFGSSDTVVPGVEPAADGNGPQ